MAANTKITDQRQTDVGLETSKFALGTGIVLASLVGIWGLICLISAFMSVGPLDVFKGYFTALFG
ncbi:MAG: hypothetical protein KAR01_07715 [Desulfocapsa sp.]|nr:hypothetical protein [Desulfocapsa sp.]